MSLKLDWEIEAEQSHQRSSGEDPRTARQRRQARLRLLLFLAAVLGVLGVSGAAILIRLETVRSEIEDQLRSTVEAEVAALRFGDWLAFSSVQRSASGVWMQDQERFFYEYQQLKLNHQVQLTGRVVDTEIDRERGRVAVEEIIDGVPYIRTWFYWRYDDGWRHVPPDYTFWGEARQAAGRWATIRYRAVDEPLASDLRARLDEWIGTACGALNCSPPPVMVEIIPDDALRVAWSPADPWLLQMPSPYVGRARADRPFDLDLQFEVANALAERLVLASSNNLQPTYPADVYYLRQAIVSWLVGEFVQVDTNAFIIQSLARNYGPAAVGRLLQAMPPDGDARVLNAATGASSLDQIELDWRDLLTWRLVTEAELIQRRDEAGFLALYDTRDAAIRDLAYRRFSAPPEITQPVVVSALREPGSDGTPQLRAVVQTRDGTPVGDVLFRLADGVWRRAN